jgi:hypothetical protein
VFTKENKLSSANLRVVGPKGTSCCPDIIVINMLPFRLIPPGSGFALGRAPILSTPMLQGLISGAGECGTGFRFPSESGCGSGPLPLHSVRFRAMARNMTTAASPSSSTTAGSRVVMAQELLHGVRPTSEFARAHIKDLLDNGQVREAIVEAYSASRAFADIGKGTIMKLLNASWGVQGRRDLQEPVLRLSEMLLYSPRIAARKDGQKPLDLGDMERLLTAEELHVVVRALAHFGHHSQALLLLEHSLHRGVPLTADLAHDLLLALSKAAEAFRYTEEEILSLFHATRQLFTSQPGFPSPLGQLQHDRQICLALLSMLLDPTHLSLTGRTTQIARTIISAEAKTKRIQKDLEKADREAEASASPADADAANSSNDVTSASGADGAQEEEQLDTPTSRLYEAASLTAKTLRERPDPLLAAATEFLQTLPQSTLFEGGLLAQFMVYCLRRGKRDKALALLDALESSSSSTTAVPISCYNALIFTDASVSFKLASSHLERMERAGVAPGELKRRRCTCSSPSRTEALSYFFSFSIVTSSSADGNTLSALALAFDNDPSLSGTTSPARFIRGLALSMGGGAIDLSDPRVSGGALEKAALRALKRGDLQAAKELLELYQEELRRNRGEDALASGSSVRTPPRWILDVTLALERAKEREAARK